MRFSLNTVCLFPGRSFEAIFPQIKERGFDTFELWSLDGVDLAALKAQKDRFGMRLSACCPSSFILNDERRRWIVRRSSRRWGRIPARPARSSTPPSSRGCAGWSRSCGNTGLRCWSSR